MSAPRRAFFILPHFMGEDGGKLRGSSLPSPLEGEGWGRGVR